MPIPVPPTLLTEVFTAVGQSSPAPAQRNGIETATRFFFQDMGLADARKIAGHIEGIDLSWPVVRKDLQIGTKLVGYRHSTKASFGTFDPFGEYFTLVGVDKGTVGIKTEDRRFVRYIVTSRTPSLQSRAKTGLVRCFGDVYGGSTQFVIPRASRCLRVLQIQNVLKV